MTKKQEPKQKPSERCPDCGGNHGDIIAGAIQAVRSADSTALGALLAAVIDADIDHHHSKKSGKHPSSRCNACAPGNILQCIIEDFSSPGVTPAANMTVH